MSLDVQTRTALSEATAALDERTRINQAIVETKAELVAAEAQIKSARSEFGREQATAVVNRKPGASKAHAAVLAARERFEQLEDKLAGLEAALIDREDALLAAEEQLSRKLESLRNSALEAFVTRYREAFAVFYDVLRDGFAFMTAFDFNLPALRAMRIYEDPLGLRMANLGTVSFGGDYIGPTATPAIVAEFSVLRQTLDAAKREGRKIQERRQLEEIKVQRERDERGDGRKCTVHENYAGYAGPEVR